MYTYPPKNSKSKGEHNPSIPINLDKIRLNLYCNLARKNHQQRIAKKIAQPYKSDRKEKVEKLCRSFFEILNLWIFERFLMNFRKNQSQ
jgi:hypothetical protein